MFRKVCIFVSFQLTSILSIVYPYRIVKDIYRKTCLDIGLGPILRISLDHLPEIHASVDDNSMFFEFHLFTLNYDVKTSAGIPKVEKNFCVRLYKIYPGYDTGSPTEDGLYKMIDPFATG